MFHRFVDCNLVGYDHFVEFIDGTYASICEHECTSFNGEIAGFLVFNTGSNDGSGETGC